jgi:hypothetical protein
LNDLFATILDAVRAPLPLPESSRSLLSASREHVFAEHYRNVGLQAIQKRVPDYQPQPFMQPCRCVIDEEFFKLIEWADGHLELYNLTNDLDETHNLSNVPDLASRIEALKRLLAEKLGPFYKNV